MLRAGISLAESLSSLAEQASKGCFKAILTDLVHEVQEGVSLSQAARKKPRVFSEIFLGMVEVGESTGNLNEVMDKLATQYERADQLRGKIVTALAYPIFIGLMATGVVIFLVTYMVPTILKAYSLPASQLPEITRIVLGDSGFIQHRWYLIILLILGFSLFGVVAGKHEGFRYSSCGCPSWATTWASRNWPCFAGHSPPCTRLRCPS